MKGTAIELVLQAGPVVKLVILILVGFSVFSWAIILYKWRFFRKAKKETEKFLQVFRSEKDLKTVFHLTRTFTVSPAAELFRSVYSESTSKDIDRTELRRILRRYIALEEAKLLKYLNFLATTGSTSPFIGLFGTVWGIMDSFRGLAGAGSAALSVVAPGIAEALIATAIGLAAAIPAVIGYNYFLSIAKAMTVQIEDFSEELYDFFQLREE